MRGALGVVTCLLELTLLVGCVGRFDYVRPMSSETPTRALMVGKSAEEVWRRVPQSPVEDRFVISGIDRDAGVVTFTYSGDPERYVDCGFITSYVKNVHGERTYRFAAATASTEYELMTGREIVVIARNMSLDARIAVTVATPGEKEARVSATARYTLVRTMAVRDPQGDTRTISHLINFDSGQEAVFPGAVACRPTGRLETDVLSTLAE